MNAPSSLTSPLPPIQPPHLDHIVINAREALDAAETVYRRLGFHLTPRGHHTLGSINHLAVFADNYIELLGVPAGQSDRRPELAVFPPGLSGLALRSNDAEDQHRALTAYGIAVGPTKRFSRPVALTNAPANISHEARFTTFQTDNALPSDGRVFYCQHHTPELVWRPEWQAHPNGTQNIVEFIFVAHRPADAAESLQNWFGKATESEIDSRRFIAGESHITFDSPNAFRQRTGHDAPLLPGARSQMAALVLRTQSIEQTARTLSENNVAYTLNSSRQIVVSAENAFGTLLIFRL